MGMTGTCYRRREKNRGENQSYHMIDGNYCGTFASFLQTDMPAALLSAGEHAF